MKSLFEHLKDFMEGWNTTWTSSTWDDSGNAVTWASDDPNNPINYAFDARTKTYVPTENGFEKSLKDGVAPMICPPEAREGDPNYRYNNLNLAYMNIGNNIQSSENADNLDGKKVGSWAVNCHMDETELQEWKKTSPEAYNENRANLQFAWNSVKSFSGKEHCVAVIGKAGWGKSEIITSVARASGFDVIVVNLAMAASEDVLGIPVPDRMATGQLRTEYAAPGWLAYVAQHPDDKICIFFDEFNQATMDVLGTIQNFLLTRQVNGVEYKNIKFMCAGNEKSENKSLVDMETLPAIKQRAVKIDWVTDWNYYFDWQRKEFEKEFGKELMDQFDANKESFMSPRNMTIHIFGWMREAIDHLKKDPTDLPIYTADRVLKMFYHNSIAKWNESEHKFENIPDSQAKNLGDLADYVAKYIYDAVTGDNTAGGSGSSFSKSKTREGMQDTDIEKLKQAMLDGKIMGDDGEFYGVCEENVYDIFDEDCYPRESVERTVKKLQMDGIKFKYSTKKECKAGEGPDVVVDLEDYKADTSGTNVQKVGGGRGRSRKK